MFISEKRDKRIKSRLVADGSVQGRHPGYKKEDSAALTVLVDRVFITGEINVCEERIIG